jgi:hypothetical protein
MRGTDSPTSNPGNKGNTEPAIIHTKQVSAEYRVQPMQSYVSLYVRIPG